MVPETSQNGAIPMFEDESDSWAETLIWAREEVFLTFFTDDYLLGAVSGPAFGHVLFLDASKPSP